MRLDRFRLGGWLVAGSCLTLACGLIVSRHAAFVRAYDHDNAIDARYLAAQKETGEIGKLRQASRFACAPARKSEETKFLKGLRRHADLAGVAIVRLGSHSSTYSKESSKGGPESTDESAVLLDGVTKISTDLTLDGSYAGLRRFLQGLWNADRLYTLSNVGWARKEQGSELTLTLSRYVAPAAAKIATP